jgi:hypothetical protein
LKHFLDEFSDEQKEFRRRIVDIMWHMRGSLSREEAWMLSPAERGDVYKMIDERMKIVEKTNLPLL